MVKSTSFFKTLLTLLFLGILSGHLYAQLPASTYCDGNPSSWNGYRANSAISYTFDVANATDPIDDNFKQAKDVNNISTWTWWLKGANDKGDITNAGALLKDGILSFFGDRTDNSGACNIGFWFLKNDVQKSSDGTTFTMGHANGDLLVLVALSQGGTLATPKIYMWQNGALVANTAAEAYACAGANPGDDTPISTAFDGYTNKDGDNTYDHNAFFEGAINLAAAGLSQCYSTFIVETRQSPSTTAALEDFARGFFNAVPAPPTPTNGDRCGSGVVNLSASCTSGTVQWYSAQTGGTLVNTGNTYSPNLSANTDYWLTCKQGDCESTPRVKISATIKAIPTLDLRVIEPTLCGTGTGTLEICGEITGYQYSLGSTTYTYSGTPIAFTGLTAGSNPSVTVTSTNGCFYTANCSSAHTTACTGGGVTTQAVTPDEEKPAIQDTREDNILARIGAHKTRVLAAPNPFSDRVRFTLVSDVSGIGTLEIYNTTGQKIATVYRGYVEADKVLNKEYVVQRSLRSNLIYVFRVGDQKTTGKLLNW